MAKKKDKATEGKKNENAEKSKAQSFLDNLRPATGKPENTRGTDHTTVKEKPGTNDKNKKVLAGGIMAVAIGALALFGLNSTSTSEDAAKKNAAPAAVSQQQPARASSEAAAASLLPKPLAPQKTRLAEPSKNNAELAKPSKATTKKSTKLAAKTKSKESVKKSTAAKKQKTPKKAKKTIAAKSID